MDWPCSDLSSRTWIHPQIISYWFVFFRKRIGKCYGGFTTIWWKCRSESESFDVLGSLLEPSSRPTTAKTKFLKKLIFAVVEIVSATHRFELHLHASERWNLASPVCPSYLLIQVNDGSLSVSIKKNQPNFVISLVCQNVAKPGLTYYDPTMERSRSAMIIVTKGPSLSLTDIDCWHVWTGHVYYEAYKVNK